MDNEKRKFFSYNPYFKIAIAIMPEYPVISAVTKNRIEREAAVFIPKQISKQPYYIFVPLRVIIYFLSMFLSFRGPSSIYLLKSIPFGRMLERMLRSLVTLIFFENHEVLSKLGEKDGKKRVEQYRAIYKNMNKKMLKGS